MRAQSGLLSSLDGGNGRIARVGPVAEGKFLTRPGDGVRTAGEY